jgi:hypothetical protein
MIKYWFINSDFHTARSNRIGASDMPACIPDPENPTQSLAGYDRTPITVVLEKLGIKPRDPSGIPAEMGHYLEPKALELFIREIFGFDTGRQFIKKKIAYENLEYPEKVEDYQMPNLHHNIQYYTDSLIAHPDCIYTGSNKKESIVKFGLKIDLSRPFIIEAKSATFWSAKRPADSLVHGYDFDLHTWQGIPLKNYVQIQFQLALFQIEVAYLVLLYNTSDFYVWEIRANEKHQADIMAIAENIAAHIKAGTIPKDSAINKSDIIEIYPKLQKDFVYISGDEKEKALQIAKDYYNAEAQVKRWTAKKEEYLDSMAVMLKNYPELRDEVGQIAKWSIRSGYEKTIKLSDIKENNIRAYNYLKKNKLLEKTADSRTVKITYKEEER